MHGYLKARDVPFSLLLLLQVSQLFVGRHFVASLDFVKHRKLQIETVLVRTPDRYISAGSIYTRLYVVRKGKLCIVGQLLDGEIHECMEGDYSPNSWNPQQAMQHS